MNRPVNDKTNHGLRIVYPIWREDLAEAIVFLENKNDIRVTEERGKEAANSARDN
jgi:hypothetical protein